MANERPRHQGGDAAASRDKPEQREALEARERATEERRREEREIRETGEKQGLARSGGTPDEQQTTGEHYAGAGGTKITADDQGEEDADGSAGASGPPGHAGRQGGGGPDQRRR